MDEFHDPVLLGEVVDWLNLESDGLVADFTLGGGGYTRAILDVLGNEGRVVAFDRDIEAVKRARERFADEPRLTVHHSRFSEAADYLKLHSTSGHNGVVMDLGVSSFQLDTPTRGFSFQKDGPLDMRMGGEGPTAAQLVNESTPAELTRIFRQYGEEKKAKAVARAIEKRRKTQPFETTLDLADVIAGVVGQPRHREGPAKHPATRCFQALRIAVNDELGELEKGLETSVNLAAPGARIVVVSYHSLEDRIVKNFFRDAAGRCHCPRHLPVCVCGAEKRVEIKTRRPVRPDDREVERNRRARSALLRVAEKI